MSLPQWGGTCAMGLIGTRAERPATEYRATGNIFVSVIIITRNRPQMMAECLAHLDAQSYRGFEIVVVDSSTDDLTAEVMQSWPGATYVRIQGRNNMPQARNVGIRHARGEIVAFIDDDSMVTPGWLGALVSGYDAPDVGGVGGRVLDSNLPPDPDEPRVGVILPTGRTIHNFGTDTGTPRNVEWFVGCNMSFRRDVLVTIGYFDRLFGDSYDDVDVAARVRAQGYRLRFVPAAVLTHLAVPRTQDVVTRDFESPQRRYYLTRNGMYFFLKNYGVTREFLRSYVVDNLYGMSVHTLKHPSSGAAKRLAATCAGVTTGTLRWMRWRHSARTLGVLNGAGRA